MVSRKQIKPFFTIITCTHNSARYLSSCLDSVEQQTTADFEHILVDGNSIDETTSIIRRYLNKSHRYPTSLLTARPRGIAAAMNAGLANARGKYIFFLHSDDSFYGSDVLSQVHTVLTANPSLDWVFGRIHEVTGEGKTVGYPPQRKIFQGKHPTILKFYNYIPHQAAFVSRDTFKKYGGFDESLKSMMDDELWLRLAHQTKWDYMPIVVANYSVRNDSQSESPTNKLSNDREYELVQSRYLTKIEMVFARAINSLLS